LAFQCFTREDIRRELQDYEKICENLNLTLFIQRNCDGSEKEYSVYESVLESFYLCKEIIGYDEFEVREAVKCLERIVVGIKELQSRKHVKI